MRFHFEMPHRRTALIAPNPACSSSQYHCEDGGFSGLSITESNMAINTSTVSFYRAEGFQPEDSIQYLMGKIINLAGQDVERNLTHADLTNAQWIPLLKLFSGHAMNVVELARQCNLDAGAMTRTLDRLEAKGLCERLRSEIDRRVVNIQLTPQGNVAARTLPGILSTIQNAHLVGFSAAEFQSLGEYLRRMFENATSIACAATALERDRA
jgi:DNA-binding MarR family transcriptional regulator